MFRFTCLVLLGLITGEKGKPSPEATPLNMSEARNPSDGLEPPSTQPSLLENTTTTKSTSAREYSTRVIFGSIAALLGLGLIGLVRSCRRFKDPY